MNFEVLGIKYMGQKLFTSILLPCLKRGGGLFKKIFFSFRGNFLCDIDLFITSVKYSFSDFGAHKRTKHGARKTTHIERFIKFINTGE